MIGTVSVRPERKLSNIWSRPGGAHRAGSAGRGGSSCGVVAVRKSAVADHSDGGRSPAGTVVAATAPVDPHSGRDAAQEARRQTIALKRSRNAGGPADAPRTRSHVGDRACRRAPARKGTAPPCAKQISRAPALSKTPTRIIASPEGASRRAFREQRAIPSRRGCAAVTGWTKTESNAEQCCRKCPRRRRQVAVSPTWCRSQRRRARGKAAVRSAQRRFGSERNLENGTAGADGAGPPGQSLKIRRTSRMSAESVVDEEHGVGRPHARPRAASCRQHRTRPASAPIGRNSVSPHDHRVAFGSTRRQDTGPPPPARDTANPSVRRGVHVDTPVASDLTGAGCRVGAGTRLL